MNEREPDERIQADANPARPPAADFVADDAGRRRTRAAGTLYGAVVGMPIAALAAGLAAWLTEYEDDAWTFALFAALIGIPVGALIGYLERTIRGDFAKTDVATFVGGGFGLTIALLVLVGTFGSIGGYWFLGMLCAGPMGGFLVGAIFDRAYEGFEQRLWGSAFGFVCLGMVACLAPIHLIVTYSAPDPRVIERETMKAVLSNWQADPAFHKAKIRKVELERVEGRSYAGTMDAAIDGAVMRFDVEVQYRHGNINVRWKPRLP